MFVMPGLLTSVQLLYFFDFPEEFIFLSQK